MSRRLIQRVIGLTEHLPLRKQLLPIILMIITAWLLYPRIGGVGIRFGWGFVSSLLTTLLLFIQLRLVDDLDDLEEDHLHQSGEARDQLRQRLKRTLCAIPVMMLLLNFDYPGVLLTIVITTLLSYAAPFYVKRYCHSMLFGSLVYEGAPAMIFVALYFSWHDSLGGPMLSATAVVAVTLLFLSGYEFWKFSRKVHSTAMQPYLLPPDKIRLALNLMLLFSLLINSAVAAVAGLSTAYRLFALVLPMLFLFWLNRHWADESAVVERQSAPSWSGMRYMTIINLVLIFELLLLN